MKFDKNLFFINGRFTTQRLTGVQRYAFEITRRLPSSAIRVVSPRPIAAEYKFLENVTIVDQLGKFAHKSGLGHLWEQFALPRWVSKEDLLWSPCGSGPLAIKNQVVTIHDIANLEHPEWFNSWFARWYNFWFRDLLIKLKRLLLFQHLLKLD